MLFLHDKELHNIEGVLETIDYLMGLMVNNISSRKLAMKFPVVVNNTNDLKKWLKYGSSLHYYSLQYRGVIDDEEIYELLTHKDYKTSPKKIDYIVTSSASDEDDFVENYLLKIFY